MTTSIGTDPAKTSERKMAAEASACAAVSAGEGEWCDVVLGAKDEVEGVCRIREEAADELCEGEGGREAVRGGGGGEGRGQLGVPGLFESSRA